MRSLLLSVAVLFCLTACKNSSSKNTTTSENAAVARQKPQLNGEKLYNTNCASCHLKSGKGVSGAYPPLADSEWLNEKRKRVIQTVKYGREGKIDVNGVTYNNQMPDPDLSDAKVAAILNYIMTSWGNSQDEKVTAKEVAQDEKP